MIPRASGALLFSYIIITIAGVLFLLYPSPTLAEVGAYEATIVIWSLFYVVGGILAATSITLRKFVSKTLPLWYFEIAGIASIVTANLLYAYALADTAFQFGELNVLAAAIIVLGFAGGLTGRIIETLRLTRYLKKYSNGEDDK